MPRHPPALPEPLLCTHLLPILPVPLLTLAPRAHPHPEPTRRALAEGKAFFSFGLHGIFDGFFFSNLLPTWLPPPFSSELVTAICSTALSVGKAGMSDWSRRDVPASGAGAWLPRSAGTAAPSTEWLQNEFSFSFFPSLVPDGLIPHFATSQAQLGCCFSHQELRFIRWSYCWLRPWSRQCQGGVR